MSYAVSVSPAGTYVVCRVTAPVTAESAREFGAAAWELGRERGLDRFLYDLRAAKNIESVQGNYDFAYSDMADLGIHQRSRAALLVDPDDHSHDFVEIVVKNAGYNVRLFQNESEAVAWLEEGTSS